MMHRRLLIRPPCAATIYTPSHARLRLSPCLVSSSITSRWQSTTQIRIKPMPSPETQQAIDEVTKVLFKLEQRSYVSQSRIHLALRGLQQPDAPLRIGLLGPNCESLLRAILHPDPAIDAPWIEELSHWIRRHVEHPSAGVLLQYGQHAKKTALAPAGTASSGVSIFAIPAEILREHSLELLIVPGATKLSNEQAFKLPNGRMIDLPVHKAVEYVGADKDGLGALLRKEKPYSANTNLRVIALESIPAGRLTEEIFSVRSLGKPEMDGVLPWILNGAQSDGTNVKPAVTRFIDDILHEALAELSSEHSASTSSPNRSIPPPEALGAAITSWNASAHHSLQSELVDSGFGSRVWHKIDWWKLLWRVDDVGNVARYVVSEYFLRRSEKEAVFLAGRIFASHSVESDAAVAPESVPNLIAEGREKIADTWILDLQAGAQAALMRSVEIAAAGGGFASLLAYSGVDVAACMGVGVIGLVVALLRMKRRWGKEKKAFEDEVKEKGRLAVLETEKWAWARLAEVGKDTLVEKEAREVVGLVEEVTKARDVVKGLGNSEN